ncbi:hypothetical protein [Synechococcus phage S-N03]|uniref:Uncharacterized protein n=1 Tax=Synechococcus phage S-N03 TaxID=2718943 RepID=A0A6G8R5U6_9CAUD|nr:hypothetical protein PQC09_gp140 [Synechococcus phage S-N03]QIN96775.1 hypothetical protein [Synechococcus phage S-N03]
MKNYTVDERNKRIVIERRLRPLIHYSMFVERLRKDYPDYTIVHPNK